MKHTAGRTAFVLLAMAATLSLPLAQALGVDCRARGLTLAESTICQDPQLSRADTQLGRRFDSLARRMSFGQYLGLRHWQSEAARYRNVCGADRNCITAHHRAQARFLDRLQQCLDTSLSRRSCLRGTMRNDQEALRR